MHSLRKSLLSRGLLFFLIAHFINLSANFYMGNSWVQRDGVEDPIDTLTEIILEWFLEVDSDVIPDSDADHEDQVGKKLKLDVLYLPFWYQGKTILATDSTFPFIHDFWKAVWLQSNFTPPDMV